MAAWADECPLERGVEKERKARVEEAAAKGNGGGGEEVRRVGTHFREWRPVVVVVVAGVRWRLE